MPTATKLCIVSLATTLDELRQQRDAADRADLVELRLDRLSPGELDVAGALSGRRTPVIVTCRPVWEGGHFQGSEAERHRVLAQALELGAEHVDIEWRAGFTDLLTPSTRDRVVLSSHEFDTMPDDLLDRARAMRSSGAGVVKIAAKAARLDDCVRLLSIAREVQPGPGDGVFIAMGECGEVSRVCAARFRSAWTYAGSIAGIGQIDPQALLDRYRFRALTPTTPIYGIVGRPVGHSVSPAMHNAAFGHEGLDGVYLTLPAADPDDFFAFAEAFGVRGVSVTIPYKVAFAEHERVTACDPVAASIGALNTLRLTEQGWEGTNTDVAGFLQPVHDRGVPLAGARAAVLGAGGSARAVVAGLTAEGALTTVHARQRPVADALAASFPGAAAGAWPVPAGSWDLLVNCTPLGMYPEIGRSPVDPAALTGRTVYDLVYNPPETQLLADAAAAGCTTIGGLDMLVAQARAQFAWWTGVHPDPAVMREAAVARLAEFQRS